MARIRTIKPEFFANEQVGVVPFQWRLLFIGLWLHADREGRLQDRPVRLKAMLFPYDDLDVEEGLGCLANAGLIRRYEGNGLRLIAIPTWAKHQQPNVKEAPSTLPPPLDDEHGASTVPALQEGNGKEQERKGTDSALRAGFDAFWFEYPRRVAKESAWREWQKLKPDAELAERMVQAVRRQRVSAQWSKDGGQFVPHPRTWLSQRRWEDESGEQRSAQLGPQYSTWVCPHVVRCSERSHCDINTKLGRPEREAS